MIKQYPVDYIAITQGYSDDHKSIDLGWKDNPNVPILSCGSGYVENIYYLNDGGNVLKIKYDDKTSTAFMHLKSDSIIVKVGDRVIRGQNVATMGDTGDATGVHLHLVMYDESGNRINPTKYLYAFPNQTINPEDESIVMRYNTYVEYTVQSGDTLWSIARKYNTTWQQIYENNKEVIGDNPNLIYPGQVLKIPNNVITYTVQPGDTLWSIAKEYNTTWQQIYENNKEVIGDNPNLIYPGQILIIS